MNYIPKIGDIIKMRSWHGIVLDVYQNESSKTVLQVHTARNVFRKLGPELIEVDLAPEHITPASMADLQQEIALHQKMLESSLQQFLDYAKQPALILDKEAAINF